MKIFKYTYMYNKVEFFEKAACFHDNRIYTKKYSTNITVVYMNLDKTIGVYFGTVV